MPIIEDKFSTSCPSGRLTSYYHHWTSLSASIASPSEYRFSSVGKYKVLSRSIFFKSYTKFETHEYTKTSLIWPVWVKVCADSRSVSVTTASGYTLGTGDQTWSLPQTGCIFHIHDYISWHYSLVSGDTELISSNSSVFRFASTTLSEVPVCTDQDENTWFLPLNTQGPP